MTESSTTDTPEQPLDGDAAVAEAFSRYSHGKKKRRKVRVMPGENITHLNLVPMMDMMTVLLVFLVKNFMTEPDSIQISETLRPPESSTVTEMGPATNVTITSEAILVDNKPVINLSEIVESGGKEVAIPRLRDALLAEVSIREAVAERGGEPFDGKLLLVAHESTPYAIITSVLYTAGEAKFSSYRLVVMKKEASKPL